MEEILGLLIPVSFAAQPLPRVRFWLLKGLVFFTFTGVVNALLPALLAGALAGRTLFDLRGLGALPGALLGALVGDVFGYWVHRAMATYVFSERMSLQLNVNNLTDEEYFERIRNNASNGWATPGAARSAVLSLAYRL